MIDARDVTVRVGARALLRACSLRVEPGAFVAIIGPNGAGKSTLLRVLSGELAPQSGTVELGGRALRAFSPLALARQRAVLPQQTRLAFPFRVREVVRFGRIPHDDPDAPRGVAIARRCLDDVALSHRAEHPMPALSGGEQQRVHLARVLAQLESEASPRVLLLDEPTSHLDLPWQHILLRRARAIARAGVAVIAVLHEIALAAAYADTLVLLAQGAVVAQGAPDVVLDDATLSSAYGHPLQVVRAPGVSHPWVTVPSLDSR